MAPADADQLMADPEETNERIGRELGDESEEPAVKVAVDQDHPFDLEGYISQYSGLTLCFVAITGTMILMHSSSRSTSDHELAAYHNPLSSAIWPCSETVRQNLSGKDARYLRIRQRCECLSKS
jgi:hypothetical protein